MPTRDRPRELDQTLHALGTLPRHDANLIIADNASAAPLIVPRTLPNSIDVHVIRLDRNRGAAARNAAAEHAVALASSGGRPRDDHWIVMLDDDSAPENLNFLQALRGAASDIAVVAAEVRLPDGAASATRREAGGLPEVFIGCGAAVRASAFRAVGGYDEAFDYYAEEYDLCARLILAGMRIEYQSGFLVRHRKVTQGRDMRRIARNLVRNNTWIMARYAPDELREAGIRSTLARYARIAWRERALLGYARGLRDLMTTLDEQPRRTMTRHQWDRFTGRAAARQHLTRAARASTLGAVAIVERGKNANEVRAAALDAGLTLAHDAERADTLLIGTLSPGPMLDAAERLRASGKHVLTAWRLASVRA